MFGQVAADIATDIVSELIGTKVTKADADRRRGQGGKVRRAIHGFVSQPETWVAVAFLLFVAPDGLSQGAGDARRACSMSVRRRSRKELAEARKLREEAQALLAAYQKKRVEAEKDAADIIDLARKEAEAYTAEARRKLAETLERRTKQAEQKIAQAEAAAIKEVRTIATDIAVAAAGRLLGDAVKGAKGDGLIADSIAAVKRRPN